MLTTSQRQQHGNVQPLLEDLPYIPYETKRQLGGTSSPEHIYFRVGGGHGYGALPLSKALQEDLESLLDGHMAAPLVDASTKLSIRLQVSSFHGLECSFFLSTITPV